MSVQRASASIYTDQSQLAKQIRCMCVQHGSASIYTEQSQLALCKLDACVCSMSVQRASASIYTAQSQLAMQIRFMCVQHECTACFSFYLY